MVAGYHLVWALYGWWLPNDPRGSGSHVIRVEKIEPLGVAFRAEVNPAEVRGVANLLPAGR